MTDDRLETIFAMQKELNRRIGVDTDAIVGDPAGQKEWLLNYCRAMSQELAELTDSVPWKWWAKYQETDVDNAKVEVVDLLHFLVSAAQVLGMDADEVFDLYTRKHRLNHARQEDGYTKKDESDNHSLFGSGNAPGSPGTPRPVQSRP